MTNRVQQRLSEKLPNKSEADALYELITRELHPVTRKLRDVANELGLNLDRFRTGRLDSDLDDLVPTDLGDGEIVFTVGRDTAGDGGGGFWYWEDGSSTAADAATVRGASSSGRWKRIYDGLVNVKWYGAKGDGTTDDTDAIERAIAAVIGKALYFPSGKYLYSRHLYFNNVGIRCDGVMSPIAGWDIYGGTEFSYTGTGVAMTLKSVSGMSWDNFLLKSYASGQSGVVVVGTYPRMANVWIQGFDGFGLRVGTGSAEILASMPPTADFTEEIGSYYGVFSAINIQNTTITGANVPYGILVDSGASSGFSSNANTFIECVIKGRYDNFARIYGTNNTYIAGNTEVWHDLATPSALYRFGGINTNLSCCYCESGTTSSTLEFCELVVHFEGINEGGTPNPHNPQGAWSCHVRDLHIQVGANEIPNSDTVVQNDGSNCTVEWSPVGFNLPGSPPDHGRINMAHNSHFRAWDSASSKPVGWHVSLGTWSRVATTRGGAYGVEATAAASRFNLLCAVTDSGGHSSPNQVKVETLRGKTVVASVWAYATFDPLDPLNLDGVGNIQITGSNGGSVGAGCIRTPNTWEKLTAVARIDDTATLVGINLRSDNDQLARNCTIMFTEPSFYIGSELNKNEPRALADVFAQMYGPIIGSPFVDFADLDTTPSVADGNNFNAINTVATTITNFDNGKNGQEITIIPTTANTTIANNANITTNTGANKLLTSGLAYKFIRTATRWVEFA